MNQFKEHYRKWWQYPRRLDEQSEHRSVSFLELFYDLVYVVLIAELAHSLAENVDLKHILQYAFLFSIVWWSWFNGTLYIDLHGNNDIRTRVFTFLQMICVAGMAAFAHDALGESSIPFALAFGAFQLTLTFLWWRVGVYDPVHKKLANPYTLAFLAATLLFLGSVFVPLSARPYLWVVSVLISLLLPIRMLSQQSSHPDIQEAIEKLLTISPALVERFGLFTIIVLGEIVVGVVTGLNHHHYHVTLYTGGTALAGILIGFGLWWVYFDFVSHRQPKKNRTAVNAWVYLHLPLSAGIAAVGAGILSSIELPSEVLPAEVRWLLTASTAAVLICIRILMNTIQIKPQQREGYRKGRQIVLVSGIAIALLGFIPLPALGLLCATLIFLLLPILYGVQAWLRDMIAQEQK